MNHYEPKIPRAALSLAALALTALSLGLTIVLPAKMEPARQESGSWTASKAGSPAPIEVAIMPAHISVVEVRERELVSAQVRNVDPKCKQQDI